MRSLFLAFFRLGIVGCCLGAADPLTFQNVRNAYEAEDYLSAETGYKKIIESSADPLSRAAANYDLGLVYVSQGEWGEAAAAFRIIAEQTSLPLALQRDARIALCEVLIHWAIEKSKDPAQVVYALDLLSEARQRFEEARRISCSLWKSAGDKECPQDSYEEPLLAWLNSIEADALFVRQALMLHPKSITEVLWESQLFIAAFKDSLPLLESLQNQPSLLKAYEEEFSETVGLFSQILENASVLVSQKVRPSFELFQDNMRQLQKYIASNQVTEILPLLKNSEEALDQWMTQLFPGKEEGSLMQLMAYYELALRGSAVSESVVNGIMQIFSKFSFEEDVNITLAKKFTGLALEKAKEGKQTSARLYLEAARTLVSNTLLSRGASLTSAADVLSLAIALERNVIKLTRVLNASSETLALEKMKLDALIEPAQQEVISFIEKFPAFAKKEQTLKFNGSEGKPGRCQHKPWDRAMPLFYHAWEDAVNGKKKSKGERLAFQEKTVENLEGALKILLEPVAEGKDSCYMKKPPAKKEETPKNEESKKSPEPIDNVMRQIQMMEQDDTIKKPQNVMRVGEKPW